jgi:hypothetical protein
MRLAAAPARKTDPGVATTRIAAAASGPSSVPSPSTEPARPFAAVSSSGVRASAGSSAPWVGRVSVRRQAVTVARA